MAGEFCRFLQASDLHLEQPLYGLTEVPDHLRELLLDAPLQAAARVFETAILENVNFVILAGDVVNPQTAGPRAMAFLLDQLEQLRDHKIAVYWCGGKDNPPEAWPEAVALPDNVQVFPKGKIKQLAHRRGDQPLASVIGVKMLATTKSTRPQISDPVAAEPNSPFELYERHAFAKLANAPR